MCPRNTGSGPAVRQYSNRISGAWRNAPIVENDDFMNTELRDRVTIYAEASLPTTHGVFRVAVFHNDLDDKEHLAIFRGEVDGGTDVPVRVHSECLTGEVLGSLKCDCREQLHAALEYLATQKVGALLYMRQEGRGIGLGNKIRAYALQEQGLDTVEANHHLGFDDDLRTYDVAAGMLARLGIRSIRLMTNNPRKIDGLKELGVTVNGRIPVVVPPNAVNRDYLATKARKSGHLIELSDLPAKLNMVG